MIRMIHVLLMFLVFVETLAIIRIWEESKSGHKHDYTSPMEDFVACTGLMFVVSLLVGGIVYLILIRLWPDLYPIEMVLMLGG